MIAKCLRAVLLLSAFGGALLLSGTAIAQDEIELPQRMGAINDYAASLGRQTREHLQSQIDRLSGEADVDLAVLISLIDPFGDPARYAEAIWSQWAMSSDRSVLLVYVREADNRWAFRVRASSDVSDGVGELRLGETRSRVAAALADRDIAEAVRLGVDALAEQWAPPPPQASSESEGSDAPPSTATDAPWWRSLWVWMAGGAAIVLVVVAVLIWAMLAWFCPRCGGRLQKRTESSMPWVRAGRGTANRSVYYCPRCRYVRRLRRRNDDRRQTRGERRRAAGRRR